MMDMTVKWYRVMDDEEINALIDYNKEQQYASANHEDYGDAEHYKQRADEWKSHLGKKLKVVEEVE
jgi:hypothetical protein